jgi:hypothetical protein
MIRRTKLAADWVATTAAAGKPHQNIPKATMLVRCKAGGPAGDRRDLSVGVGDRGVTECGVVRWAIVGLGGGRVLPGGSWVIPFVSRRRMVRTTDRSARFTREEASMAIRMRMRWDGATQELYDAVRTIVDWEGDPAPGGLLHVAWFVGDQLNVCDIWETPEEFNTFVETRLMPGVARAGVPGQPEVEIHPVYNWQLEKSLTPGSVIEEDELPVDAYMALEAKVGWREEPPIGGVLHIACVAGDMVQLVTMWESEADEEKFGIDRVGPVSATLGFPEPPPPHEFHKVHALFHPAWAPARS